MGRREDNRQRLRAELVQAALALFHERGFADVRVVDIAARVGVSEKTFFNHFPSKSSVLEVVSDQLLSAYSAALHKLIAEPERAVVDRLSDVVALWASGFGAAEGFAGEAIQRTGMFFGAEGRTRARQQEAQRLLAGLIEQGQKNGELRRNVTALQLSELLTAMLLLTTANWIGGWWEREDTLRGRLDRAFSVYISGVRVGQNKRAAPKTSRSQEKRRRHAR